MNAAPQSRDSFKLELAAEILRKFAEVRFVARGTSMLPAIYPGDCLTVRSFGDAVPRCGEIVLCRRAGEFRVHRIVRLLEEGPATLYVLRGDALTDDDPAIPARELLGRVTSLVRRGKPYELNAATLVQQRVLRLIVRRSKIAAAILLGWQAMQARYFQRAETRLAGSVKARTEYT